MPTWMPCGHGDDRRGEVQDARDAGGDERVGGILRGMPGRGDDPDRDVPLLHHLGDLVEVTDAHAPDHRADLGGVDVDDATDREPSIAEPVVAGERLAEVAGADDDDGPVVGEAEFATDLVHEEVDVVAHAPRAVAAEVAQVLADLGRVHAAELGELLGRDRRDALLELVGEDAQVHRQTGHRGLGDPSSHSIACHAPTTLGASCTLSQSRAWRFVHDVGHVVGVSPMRRASSRFRRTSLPDMLRGNDSTKMILLGHLYRARRSSE